MVFNSDVYNCVSIDNIYCSKFCTTTSEGKSGDFYNLFVVKENWPKWLVLLSVYVE